MSLNPDNPIYNMFDESVQETTPQPVLETPSFDFGSWNIGQPEEPAGRAGWFHRHPSKKELAEQRRQNDIRQIAFPFAPPRKGVYRGKRVLVANLKGGVNKTLVACLIAAGFGQWSGKQVALVENSPTGSLRLRLEWVPAEPRTLTDLAETIATMDPATAAGILQSQFMVWQNQGRFSALLGRVTDTRKDPATGEMVLLDPTITRGQTVDTLDLIARSYQFTIIDSANSLSDAQWLGSVDVADQLVIATTWDGEALEDAKRILRVLMETGHELLAREAIIVESHAPGVLVNEENIKLAGDWFARYSWPVLHIPPDQNVHNGKPIMWDELSMATHDATRELCAAIAARLQAHDNPDAGWK